MLLASEIRLVLFLFCRLERKNFIRLSKQHLIVLYLQIFNTTFYSFQNLSLGFIFKIFLKFPKFQPRYSYETYSYKKQRHERV